jgi:hypothetical protein
MQKPIISLKEVFEEISKETGLVLAFYINEFKYKKKVAKEEDVQALQSYLKTYQHKAILDRLTFTPARRIETHFLITKSENINDVVNDIVNEISVHHKKMDYDKYLTNKSIHPFGRSLTEYEFMMRMDGELPTLAQFYLEIVTHPAVPEQLRKQLREKIRTGGAEKLKKAGKYRPTIRKWEKFIL